ncbi:hypothetical protein KGP36_06790 [Patescibacteria group bacterium]|nr:hypothetical protein [Patescibacteria group bacterium]
MSQKTYDFTETLQELDAGVFLQKVSKAVRDEIAAFIRERLKEATKSIYIGSTK